MNVTLVAKERGSPKLMRTNVRKISSIAGFVRGLMFSRPRALLFDLPYEKKVSLHTWFVFFGLQIIGVDRSGRITEKAVLKPFSFIRLKYPVNKIIEIPEDQKLRVKPGMKVQIIECDGDIGI